MFSDQRIDYLLFRSLKGPRYKVLVLILLQFTIIFIILLVIVLLVIEHLMLILNGEVINFLYFLWAEAATQMLIVRGRIHVIYLSILLHHSVERAFVLGLLVARNCC